MREQRRGVTGWRAAAVVVSTLPVAVLAACGTSASAQPEVRAQHTASQVPADVVRAYLVAVQREDGASAAELSTPGFAAEDPWQNGEDPGLRDVDVSPDVVPYDTTWSPDELKQFEQVVSVQTTFTVTDPDQGFPPGEPTSWGYLLARHSDRESWSIAGAGNG